MSRLSPRRCCVELVFVSVCWCGCCYFRHWSLLLLVLSMPAVVLVSCTSSLVLFCWLVFAAVGAYLCDCVGTNTVDHCRRGPDNLFLSGPA